MADSKDWRTVPEVRAPSGGAAHALTILVPVRNEERVVASCLRAALEALDRCPTRGAILVLDDASSDLTLRVARSVEDPRITVIESHDGQGKSGQGKSGQGKSGALAAGFTTLAGAGDDDLLVFIDADVTLSPSTLQTVLPLFERYDFVSLSSEQRATGFLTESVQLLVFDLLDRIFPFERVNDPEDPLAAANGQFIATRVGAYRAAGTHAAVDGEVLEDIALATSVKRAGFPAYFGPGKPHGVSCRMYGTLGELVDGWSKNLYLLSSYSWSGAAAHLSLAILSSAAYLLAHVAAYGALGAAGVGIVFAVASCLLSIRTGRSTTPAHVVAGTILVVGILARSAWWCVYRGEIRWRGRWMRIPSRSESSKR